MVSVTSDAVANVRGILERSTITFCTWFASPFASCARAFSPTMDMVLASLSPLTTLEYFTTVVLMPPHKPLSEDTGTIMVFSASMPGWSPSMRIRGCTMPRDFSILVCAPFNRDAATIFIAAVIFWMLPTDFMRCATICRDTERVPLGASLFARGGMSRVSVRACEASVQSREAPRAASVASSRGKSREQGFARESGGTSKKTRTSRGRSSHWRCAAS